MRQDTLLGRTRRFAKDFGPSMIEGTIVGTVLGTLAAFGIVLFVVMPDNTDRAARKTCDRAVEVLLTSRDPVELQRSGILIHELDCSISRRLPKEP